MKKKIDIFKDNLKTKIDDFRCPICETDFSIDDYSLRCQNNHVFDINKRGYINFQPKNKHKQYNKELFEVRDELSQTGFYEPLLQKLFEIIKEFLEDKNITVLDIGAGGGYHLNELKQLCENKNNTYIGMDISSDAVFTAAKYYSDILWCVSDAGNIVLKDNTVDVILNILSPVNYSEVKRVLKDEGIFIKVLPEKNYLKELREYFFKGTVKEEYSNEEVFELLSANMSVLKAEDVCYNAKISKNDLRNLAYMTPLTSAINKKDIDVFIENSNLKEISVDLKVCIGRK